MIKYLKIVIATGWLVNCTLSSFVSAQEMIVPSLNSGPPLQQQIDQPPLPALSQQHTPIREQFTDSRQSQQQIQRQPRVTLTGAQGVVEPLPVNFEPPKPSPQAQPLQLQPGPTPSTQTPLYQSPFAQPVAPSNLSNQQPTSNQTLSPNDAHVAYNPPGYPSGYPGDTTSAGQPLGYGPSTGQILQPGQIITSPSLMPPSIANPTFSQPQFFMPGGAQAIVTPDGVVIQEPGDPPVTPPPAGKNGALQAISLTDTYLPNLGGSGFSENDVESYLTLGFPFPTRESPLLISPVFNMHFLNGPTSQGPNSPDLPTALYDTYLEVRWLRRLSDQMSWITLSSSVSPGWYSDWQTNSTQAIRAPAQTLIIADWSTTMQYIAGIAYLDREDIKLLPVIGFIWKPNDSFKLEAVAPRPKIAVRTHHSQYSEDWWSIAGEFGGGQWAIQRANGAEDILISRDYRIIFGAERKSLTGNWGSRLEIGYVFSRTFEYRNTPTPDFEPDSTLLVRAGILY